MGLILFLVAMVGSWIPLFFLPVATGGWFLVALLSGVLTAFIGTGLMSASALSDNVGPGYYVWWSFSIVMTVGGGGLAIWSLAWLIWRGAGLSVDVSVTQ